MGGEAEQSEIEPLLRGELLCRLSVLAILMPATEGWRLAGAVVRVAGLGSEAASGSSGTGGSGLASNCVRCRFVGEVEMRSVRLSSRRIWSRPVCSSE